MSSSNLYLVYISWVLSKWLSGKESTCNTGDMGSILGREDLLEKEMATYCIFLPGKSHGQRNLEGYSLCGLKV